MMMILPLIASLSNVTHTKGTPTRYRQPLSALLNFEAGQDKINPTALGFSALTFNFLDLADEKGLPLSIKCTRAPLGPPSSAQGDAHSPDGHQGPGTTRATMVYRNRDQGINKPFGSGDLSLALLSWR